MSKRLFMGALLIITLVTVPLLVGRCFPEEGWVGRAAAAARAHPQLATEAGVLAREGPEACVVDGLERLAACGGEDCDEARLRTNICLHAAEIPRSFCESVDIGSLDGGFHVEMWAASECNRRRYAGEDEPCHAFLVATMAPACAYRHPDAVR